MTDFEDTLRRRLAEAANDAPRYRADLLDEAPVPRSRRSRPSPRLLVAAAVVALVGAVAVWTFPGRDPGTDGAASCASPVLYDGRTYSYRHELLAVPQGLRPLGRGTIPGCDDGGGPAVDDTVDVFALRGVDAADVLVSDRAVWTSTDAPLPRSVRPLLRALPCDADADADADRTVDGTVTALVDRRPAEDFAVTPPYRLELWVDGGDVPGGYAEASIRVAVTTDTAGGGDRDLLRAALVDADRVRVVVHCDGARYVAVSLSRA